MPHVHTPKQGDVVLLAFDPRSGHEQAGRRPVYVVSASAYNRKVGLAVFCPITNRAKGYPFEVTIPEGAGVSGVILADQLKSLDWKAHKAELLVSLPDEVHHEVLAKSLALLQA